MVVNRSASERGSALLGLAAWIRRQGWLRRIYQHFPQSLRNRVSLVLAAPARKRVRFPRTPAWDWAPSKPVTRPTNLRSSSGLAFDGSAGVNIFAYFRGQFGLGESARLYTRALIDAGYPVALFDIGLQLPHGFDDGSLDDYLSSETPYDIHLLFVNPDYLEDSLHEIGRAKLARGYVIACWFWELEIIPPEWLPALDIVDEIMVSSSFVEAAFRRVTDKPILRIPLPLGDEPDSGLSRTDFGLRSNAFIFLVTFDFNSWLDRKNPFAAIEAFMRAFPLERDDVQLLVKSSNGYRHPEPFLRLLNAASNDSRIVVRDEVIGRHHIQAMQRCADAYVSLHRAEGFGLGLAESMRLGKPVVATAWSGNVDFMDERNSLLVDYELVPVETGQYSHSQGQRWAEANIEQAATCMRRLVDEPGLAERIGNQARKDIHEKLSARAIADCLIGRLRLIHGDRITIEPPTSFLDM
ncbi:glycosyltransferase family 4 protein [Rhodanobacter thiooxydans]|uniref:glycosyltransferase family 4 protein n=1 Tax=Rhodanobacter thiooxydans TaxID=416169 RepID=UPI000ACD21FF